MPKSVPMEQVIDVVVLYIVKRQLQGRPTTLRQVSKRVGLGAPTIKAQLEKYSVKYVLIPYGEKEWVTSSTEIAIQSMPSRLAERNGLTIEQVEQSYVDILDSVELEPLESEVEEEEDVEELDPVTNMDPYYPYRIDTNQYQALKHELIDYRGLIREARKRGYSGSAIMRAVGGDRMRYALPGPLWRPYVYRNKRYYLREVLNHLNQCYRTYKLEKTGEKKRYRRKKNLETAVLASKF